MSGFVEWGELLLRREEVVWCEGKFGCREKFKQRELFEREQQLSSESVSLGSADAS